MAAPTDVQEGLDRLAAEVTRLRSIVDSAFPDFFQFDHWQQQPPDEPPPWMNAPGFQIPDFFQGDLG